MSFPLQISFKDIGTSTFVRKAVRERAAKWERFFDRIVSAQVVISAPHHRQRRGTVFHVQVRVHLPGNEIFFTSDPEKNHAHEDVYVAIRDAFVAVERRLKKHAQKIRAKKKKHYSARTTRALQ